MDEITWTVSEPGGEVRTTGKRTQLAYRAAFEVKEGTPKAQLVTIESFNEMRQCLLDNGLMKSK
jgi:pantothenate kinase